MSVFNQPVLAEHCRLGFTVEKISISVRGHVKPASETLIRCTDVVYDICGQNSFLILSGVRVLHIFKKSLAIRSTGEQLYSGDRTGSKLSSFYFAWLVRSNYTSEFPSSAIFVL